MKTAPFQIVGSFKTCAIIPHIFTYLHVTFQWFEIEMCSLEGNMKKKGGGLIFGNVLNFGAHMSHSELTLTKCPQVFISKTLNKSPCNILLLNLHM